jgi:flagellar biosynthesis chaperone FliJ
VRAAAVRAVAEAGEIVGAELEARAQVMAIAGRDMSRAEQDLEQRNKERDAHSEGVAEATREVRVMENLQDRLQRAVWREETTREQMQLDEMTAQKRRPT